MANIKDIAEHLGISISTVSKSLNNATDVSDETKEKVLNAALELGYSPKRRKNNGISGFERKVCIFIENMDYTNNDQFGYDLIKGYDMGNAIVLKDRVSTTSYNDKRLTASGFLNDEVALVEEDGVTGRKSVVTEDLLDPLVKGLLLSLVRNRGTGSCLTTVGRHVEGLVLKIVLLGFKSGENGLEDLGIVVVDLECISQFHSDLGTTTAVGTADADDQRSVLFDAKVFDQF